MISTEVLKGDEKRTLVHVQTSTYTHTHIHTYVQSSTNPILMFFCSYDEINVVHRVVQYWPFVDWHHPYTFAAARPIVANDRPLLAETFEALTRDSPADLSCTDTSLVPPIDATHDALSLQERCP